MKETIFDNVILKDTWFTHTEDTTRFYTSIEVMSNTMNQTYIGYATFPKMTIDNKIWELWLTCVYLHLLNFQPFTNSKILPPNGLNDYSILFCNDLYSHNYQIWNKIFGRNIDISEYISNYPEFDPKKYNIENYSKVAVAMSGGKESSLAYHISVSYGLNTSGIFIDYIGKSKRREGQRMSEYLKQVGDNPVVITSNLIDFLCLLPSQYGKHSMYLSPTIMLLLMQCYCSKKDTLLVGNEYDNTCPKLENGTLYFGDNYEQSTVFERKLTQYLHDIGIDIQVFSPLYNLTETCIQSLLVDTSYFNYQESCLVPIKDNSNNYVSCGNCSKCKRIAAIIQSIGINTYYFDPAIFKNSSESIFNSLNGTDEAETLVYLLNQQGIYFDTSIESTYHKNVFQYNIDDMHPRICPLLSNYVISMVQTIPLNRMK